MEKKVIFDIRQLSKSGYLSVYDNVLAVAEVDTVSIKEEDIKRKYYSPNHSNRIGMLWTLTGTCVIQIEDMPFSLSTNNFLLIPSWESIQLSAVSSDFKAHLLVVEKSFLNECITNKQVLSFFNYLLIKRMLQTELTPEETNVLGSSFSSLKEKITTNTHSYYKEVVPVNFFALLLDLSHILKSKRNMRVSNQSMRKEEIFNKFLDLLLDNYKEQHEVAFYADKLFITPQYLTLIIKELTGKTTNKWIDDTLILEARKMLKTTQTTVQQIADYLNFSDQSTFGKFFKKYHGISPAEYRKTQTRAC